MPRAEVDGLFDVIDRDGSGELDYRELMKALRRKGAQAAAQVGAAIGGAPSGAPAAVPLPTTLTEKALRDASTDVGEDPSFSHMRSALRGAVLHADGDLVAEITAALAASWDQVTRLFHEWDEVRTGSEERDRTGERAPKERAPTRALRKAANERAPRTAPNESPPTRAPTHWITPVCALAPGCDIGRSIAIDLEGQEEEYARALADDQRREAAEAEALAAEAEAREAEEAAAAVEAAREAEAVQSAQDAEAAAAARVDARRAKAAALPVEPPAGEEATRLVIRLPDGRRLDRRFAKDCPLQAAIDYVESSEPEIYELDLVANYPRKVGARAPRARANARHARATRHAPRATRHAPRATRHAPRATRRSAREGTTRVPRAHGRTAHAAAPATCTHGLALDARPHVPLRVRDGSGLHSRHAQRDARGSWTPSCRDTLHSGARRR